MYSLPSALFLFQLFSTIVSSSDVVTLTRTSTVTVTECPNTCSIFESTSSSSGSLVSYATSTVYSSSVYTITSCAPAITNCPVGMVTTDIISLYTTICPVTETQTAPATSSLPQYTTSTVRSTVVSTVSLCAPTITNCPARSTPYVTTIIIDISTTICPVTATESDASTITGRPGSSLSLQTSSILSSRSTIATSSNATYTSSSTFSSLTSSSQSSILSLSSIASSNTLSSTASSTSPSTGSLSASATASSTLSPSSGASSSTLSSIASSTSLPTDSLSTSSTTSSTSVSISSTSSSSVASASAIPTFFLYAQTANSNTNGFYAEVVSGSLSFTATSEDTASGVYVDSAGHLIYNGLYGQITPGSVSQVQFVNAVSFLEKRQPVIAVALICTVTADITGTSVLTCSADGQSTAQVCGASYYLGSALECEPLVVGFIAQGAPTTGVPVITYTPGTASAPFALQFNVGGYYALYGASPSSNPGGVSLYFEHYGSGPTFNLDANGHFVSIGPVPSTGALVPYVAAFPIGSTQGPILEMTGAIPDGYVAIVCSLVTNPVAGTTSLTCQDGANGLNNVLQACGTSDVLSLGVSIGTGCKTSTVFNAVFAAS